MSYLTKLLFISFLLCFLTSFRRVKQKLYFRRPLQSPSSPTQRQKEEKEEGQEEKSRQGQGKGQGAQTPQEEEEA